MILSFNLYVIIFGFCPITFCLIDLIFFISCSSSVSISPLAMVIGLWNSSSLSFNFLFFWPLKIGYLASFFFLLIFSFLQPGYPCLYIHQNLLEKLWKEKLLYLKQFNQFLGNFQLFCSQGFPFFYIHKKFLKNLWKQKILYLKQFEGFLSNIMLLCSSDFLLLYIHEIFLKKLMKTKNNLKHFKQFFD